MRGWRHTPSLLVDQALHSAPTPSPRVVAILTILRVVAHRASGSYSSLEGLGNLLILRFLIELELLQLGLKLVLLLRRERVQDSWLTEQRGVVFLWNSAWVDASHHAGMSDLLLRGRIHDSFLVLGCLAFRPGHLSIFYDRNRGLNRVRVGDLRGIYETIILTHRC